MSDSFGGLGGGAPEALGYGERRDVDGVLRCVDALGDRERGGYLGAVPELVLVVLRVHIETRFADALRGFRACQHSALCTRKIVRNLLAAASGLLTIHSAALVLTPTQPLEPSAAREGA